MPDTFRSFIAVVLDSETRRALTELASDLGRDIRGVKWVAPESIHATLVFLGDIDSSMADRLTGALASVAASAERFDVEARGLGTFGSRGQPRVVWVGAGAGKQPLVALANDVRDRCRSLGLPVEDRPFSAHLTLGRIRDRLDPAGARVLADRVQEAADRPYATFPVDRVCLMRSDLRPTGAVYTVVSQFPLAGGRE